MSRIEPISPSRALVRLVRETAEERAQADAGDGPPAAPARLIRPSTMPRPELGDAAAAAAFEIHRLVGGGPRGLKADLGVRRQWLEAYRTALDPDAEARRCCEL